MTQGGISLHLPHSLSSLQHTTNTHPAGWHFATPSESSLEMATAPEPVTGASFLRDIYHRVNPDYSGRYTVPTLWDTKSGAIVSNESSEIIRMLYEEFDEFVPAEKRGGWLLPEGRRAEIDGMNEWVYDTVNNGVYKAGFATSQGAYEAAVGALFESLQWLEDILAASPGKYLLGDELTEVDVRLFTTIVRFDPVYVQHFKCNVGMIRHEYVFAPGERCGKWELGGTDMMGVF
jgi:putative glutathione S-transferase